MKNISKKSNYSAFEGVSHTNESFRSGLKHRYIVRVEWKLKYKIALSQKFNISRFDELKKMVLSYSHKNFWSPEDN